MIKKTYLWAALVLLMASCKTSQRADLGDGLFADIKTSHGDIIVKLEHEKTPVTVANFISLAEGNNPFVSEQFKGKKYYDGLTFHRVIPNFVVQGGCPDGTGAGGPGYSIDCELDGDNQYHDRGVLSMAHAVRNTGGSQFFICHSRDNTAHLDRNHTVFGKVVEGEEVIDDIRQGTKIEKITINES